MSVAFIKLISPEDHGTPGPGPSRLSVVWSRGRGAAWSTAGSVGLFPGCKKKGDLPPSVSAGDRLGVGEGEEA